MEELLELHDAITEHRYDDALAIVEEMTAMAKKDIIDKLSSLVEILLIHLIKCQVEQRTTHSWTTSIIAALAAIKRYNARDTRKGVYLEKNGFQEQIDEVWSLALRKASLEAFGGKYSPREFAQLVDAEAVKAQALDYILNGYPTDEDM
jgi:hypothetical protein